jgi:P-loop ATPase protein family
MNSAGTIAALALIALIMRALCYRVAVLPGVTVPVVVVLLWSVTAVTASPLGVACWRRVMSADLAPVRIISFGYGHGTAPEAHATFDVRGHFKDPHVNPALRYLTAADSEVMEAVVATSGVIDLINAIVATVRAFRLGPKPAPITIAIGCVGGRHRSAAIAIEVARALELYRIPVTLTHRDMALPVIERPVGGAS